MILESIVVTTAEDGRLNLAPMGPVVSTPETLTRDDQTDPGFVLRPFEGSTTFDNLMQSRRATIHIVDDVRLIADSVMGKPLDVEALTERLLRDGKSWSRLKSCHRWFAVLVDEIRSTPPRFEMVTRVIESGIVRPTFGFNRAKHAVIEAAILATRTHLIPRDEIQMQLNGLQPLVKKTGGPVEVTAFDELCDFIEQQLNAYSESNSNSRRV